MFVFQEGVATGCFQFFRQTSCTLRPDSAYLIALMIWLSVNFDFFM